MLYKYRKIVIILGLIFTIGVFSLFLFLFQSTKTAPTPDVTPAQQEEKTQKLKSDLNLSIGGTILQNGFEISYLNTEQIYVINITDNPFQGNLTKALNWVKAQGIDPAKLQYICSVSQGVDVTELEINKCGTANIGN